MKLPHRREKDETRTLKNMGEALGWTRSEGSSIAYKHLNPDHKIANVVGTGNVDPYANSWHEVNEKG